MLDTERTELEGNGARSGSNGNLLMEPGGSRIQEYPNAPVKRAGAELQQKGCSDAPPAPDALDP